MTTYVAQRVAQSLLLLFLVSILFFVLTHLRPDLTCAFRGLVCQEDLHLDQPLATQYLLWLQGLGHGSLGRTNQGQPIGSLIAQKLPATILLVGTSLLLQQLIAIPLGILAALRPYSALDSALTFLSYLALCVPAFVLGFVLIALFAVHWPLFPVGHAQDVTAPVFWSGDWFSALLHNPLPLLGGTLYHLALPVTVLTVAGIAVDSRYMRAAMLQVLHEDYLRTARAKGLTRRRIIFKHALRNALLPILTNLGLYLPVLVGGVIAVEAVFTWDGLGYAFYQATGMSQVTVFQGQLTPVTGAVDMPTMLALLLLSTAAVIVANLLADLAYPLLDPRIRYHHD